MAERDQLILVAGAGGFIGGHLVADLQRNSSCRVRAVDSKPVRDWHQRFDGVEQVRLDLSDRNACLEAVEGVAQIYNLAADMGGMGFIESNRAHCMLNVLINAHLLMAAKHHRVERYFFSSSACAYPTFMQTTPDARALREDDAYPAMPEDGYGWEKLFSERMCRHFSEDFGVSTRIARYFNVYGPHGAFEGGREKAPAAICRKVIHAKLTRQATIEVWGDGEQTRSFMFIDDCVLGTRRLMMSDIDAPANLGSSQLVTVNQLVDIVEGIAGVTLRREYDLAAPKGVRGRNSDNSLIRERLGWEPTVSLEAGLEATYRWIHDQMTPRYR